MNTNLSGDEQRHNSQKYEGANYKPRFAIQITDLQNSAHPQDRRAIEAVGFARAQAQVDALQHTTSRRHAATPNRKPNRLRLSLAFHATDSSQLNEATKLALLTRAMRSAYGDSADFLFPSEPTLNPFALP
jgi:hypothetical protein